MQYMLMIFAEEQIEDQRVEEKGFEAYIAPWVAYTQSMQDGGVYVSGEPLSPSHTSTTVSVRDNKRAVQDGPFIDSKEQLGGFYIIDVPSLDDAIRWAEKCPAAAYGHIEVRPVADMSGDA